LAIRGGAPVRSEPYPPWPVWGREEEEMLLTALRSGVWGIGGALGVRLGEEFAAYVGCRFGVPCMNGTVALKVALRAVGVDVGKRVVTTPYTFISTSSVLIELGALPVYVDIVDDGVNIDPRLVGEVVDGDTAAILPVHVGGHPAEMDRIMEVSRLSGVAVVEDAAEAHGSEWKSRRVGSIGTLGCFSFQSSKVMTSGEGGMITTSDESLAALCKALINCGRRGGKDWYETGMLGYNYRMTEFQAAVLLAQLRRLDEQIARRETNFGELARLCRDLEGFSLIHPPDGSTRTAHYLIILRINPSYFRNVSKERIVEALKAEGIPASNGWPVPLYRYRPIREYLEMKGLRIDASQFTNTEKAASEYFFIHHRVLMGGTREVMDVYEALRKIERRAAELA